MVNRLTEMKKAVMYGGGNIGRGFIGLLLSDSGYHVDFIDVAPIVVNTLQADKCYPVRYVDNEGYQDILVDNVDAIDGNDSVAVAEAIAQADIMATAVGARILKFIVPNIVAGIRKRWENGRGALNIMICENLNDANKIFEGLIKEHLSPEECERFDDTIGLVEASIGRMVPVQTDEMKDGNPLRVCVEKYAYLPVDKAAFKGEIPMLKGLVPYEPFDYFIKRKLFIHNMGHAVTAYLGGLFGYDYICDAISDPEIRLITQNAMLESAVAISKKYGQSLSGLMDHVVDLLSRFRNAALKDTCSRVGGDPSRKLGPDDRLIGASRLIIDQSGVPSYVALAAACAIKRLIDESENAEHNVERADQILSEISKLESQDPLKSLILEYYSAIGDGHTLQQLRSMADNKKASSIGKPV